MNGALEYEYIRTHKQAIASSPGLLMSPAPVILQVVLKVGQASQEDQLGHTETNLCRELDSTDLEHEGSGHPAISGIHSITRAKRWML